MWIIPLAFLLLFEGIADIFAKEWSLKNHIIFWALSISCYLVANIFWLVAIKNGSELARGATIFSIGSAILAVVIGFFFYKESVTTLELIGMVVGLIALVLIFWNDLATI